MILIYPSHHFAPDLTEHIGLDEQVIHATDVSEFEDRLEDADIVLTNQWNEEWDSFLENIEMIQITSAGYDHLPVETFKQKDITVANASGVHGEPIAEHVFAYLLALERNLFDLYESQKRHEWRDGTEMMPGEVDGKTLTIVGVGAIGGAIAEKARAFGMQVNGIDPDPPSIEAVDYWYSPDETLEALTETDYLVLACPLTEATRGMIGQSELETLPTDASVINIARGEVIKREALETALRERSIGTAVLDVTWEEPLPEDSPFWDFENCFITPHLSGLSPRYGERLAAGFEKNYKAFMDENELPTGIE